MEGFRREGFFGKYIVHKILVSFTTNNIFITLLRTYTAGQMDCRHWFSVFV